MKKILIPLAIAILAVIFIPKMLSNPSDDGSTASTGSSGIIIPLLGVGIAILLITLLSKKGSFKKFTPSVGTSKIGWGIGIVIVIVLLIVFFKTNRSVKIPSNEERGMSSSTGSVPVSTPILSAPPPEPALPGPDLEWGNNELVAKKRYYFDRDMVYYMFATDSADYGSSVHYFKEGYEGVTYWDVLLIRDRYSKINKETDHRDGSKGRFYFTVNKNIKVYISGSP